MSQPVEASAESTGEVSLLPLLLQSRWAARSLFAVSALLGCSSVVFFIYSMQGGDPLNPSWGRYRDHPQEWPRIAGHLVRAVLGLWIAQCFWRYLRSLEYSSKLPEPRLKAALVKLNACWDALAFSCLGLLTFAILSVMALTNGLLDFELQTAPRFTKLQPTPKSKIEVRLAEFESRPGLLSTTMTVTEPVEKPIYLHEPALIDNADIENVAAIVDESGHPALLIKFVKNAHDRIKSATEAHMNRPMAIVIDGKVRSAPVLQSRFAESAQVTGAFTEEEVERIARDFNGK